MNPNLTDFFINETVGEEDKNIIKLTKTQREANVFIKKMMASKATKAVVNKEYFAPIYKELRGEEIPNGKIKLGAVEIEFSKKIKKYYFI